jgi:hypothetical protein
MAKLDIGRAEARQKLHDAGDVLVHVVGDLGA